MCVQRFSTAEWYTVTGRFGSRRQLAENMWLVSLGCSGGPQWSCRVHLHIIQLGFKGKLILRKIGRFSLCACGNGMNLPHAAKHAFGDQIGPDVQKAMPFGSPPSRTENCGLSRKKQFSFFKLFLPLVIFLPFSCCWPYFEAGILFGDFSSIRVTKFNLGLMEDPCFEKLAD